MIRTCKKCGFILGTRPGLKEENDICLACLNAKKKLMIDWQARQRWLSDYLAHREESFAAMTARLPFLEARILT